MQIYIHRSETKELELIEVEEMISVKELAQAHGGDDASVWLEDEEESLAPEVPLKKAGVKDRGHVHVSKKCKKIEVQVRYAGDPKLRKFAPSATIARVFKWATGKKGFDLTPTERAKHTLGLCGTTTEPDKSEHVGSLANPDCTLCLDLAPKERFEG
ncbi:MAG TPA: hypothetical protein VF176_10610 [Solirubrobacterales bacterium]